MYVKVTMAMASVMFLTLISLSTNYAKAADAQVDEVVNECEEDCGNFPGRQFNECFDQCVESGGPAESDWAPEFDCDECYECDDDYNCEFQHTDECVEWCLNDGEDVYGDYK